VSIVSLRFYETSLARSCLRPVYGGEIDPLALIVDRRCVKQAVANRIAGLVWVRSNDGSISTGSDCLVFEFHCEFLPALGFHILDETSEHSARFGLADIATSEFTHCFPEGSEIRRRIDHLSPPFSQSTLIVPVRAVVDVLDPDPGPGQESPSAVELENASRHCDADIGFLPT
jgi:hypothetical protein